MVSTVEHRVLRNRGPKNAPTHVSCNKDTDIVVCPVRRVAYVPTDVTDCFSKQGRNVVVIAPLGIEYIVQLTGLIAVVKVRNSDETSSCDQSDRP
jgi:hypothetical protein